MKNREIEADTKAIRTHLKAIAVNGRVTIQTFKSKSHSHAPKWEEIVLGKESIRKLAKDVMAGASIGVCVQKMDGKGRKKENVSQIRYLVIDIDSGSFKMKDLKEFKIQPGIVLRTSPGKYHLYFRIECALEEYSRFARAIAEKVGGDIKACDSSHVFRIAGTVNWKDKDDPFVTQLKRCERKKPTPMHVLCKAFGIAPLKKKDHVKSINVSSSDADAKIDKGEVSADALRKALEVIDSDDRKVWLDIGMSLHSWSQMEGRPLWDDWSKKSSKYDQADQERTWESFRQDGGKTVSTIFYYAKKANNQVPSMVERMTIPVDEADVVEHIAMKLKGRLLVVGDDTYYVFDQHHWKRDNKLAARMVLGVIKDLYMVAIKEGNANAAKRLKGINNYGAAAKLMKNLNAYEHFDAKSEAFDSNPELLGVPNGVVELKDGTFRKGRPEDMITITTRAEYDADAKCPRFNAFLKTVMPSKEYRKFFRRLCGYWLVGNAKEQKAFFFLGKGSNGKGTITRVTEAVLGGKLCTTISPSYIKNATQGNPNSPTPAVMPLRDARVIFCTESARSKGIDEVFFKQLTGNDVLTGRHNYGEQQSFTPPGKLVITTNVMPDWTHFDDALWRRVIVIPFEHSFTGEQRDNNLDTTLQEEASGILNFMIRGAEKYLKHGLRESQEVIAATKAARIEADSVNFWISQECKRAKRKCMRAKDAYAAYTAFTKVQKRTPATVKQFAKSMEDLGFARRRRAEGFYYLGISLLQQ
nr:phage/plasmid primase, P4 family [Herbaspirillum sp. B39]